jgi:general secretion pathway protein A
MYKAFFKLNRYPFEITPDPSCFVPTKHHDEALASLYYGVRGRKGLVVVTGEVGTGKTFMLRCLLRLLQQSPDMAYAYLFNSTLSPTEFLQYIVADYGLPASGKNKCELLTDLSKFLIERGSKQLTTVLIVDEAHQLSAETLEEIRLLSNLETTTAKLLQIMLVGQPELDEKLDSAGLRQLKQRIALRTQLYPLTAEETGNYIDHRLKVAGADPATARIFSVHAIVKIHRYSQGLPRLINTICENSLITAYARRQQTVNAEIIEEVARDFRLGVNAQGAKDDSQNRVKKQEMLVPIGAPVAGGVSVETRIPIEESKYEPNI